MFDSIDGMSISLPTDTDGLVGRECPVEECEGYFKIKLETGIVEDGYDKCFCPYCGHKSVQDQFWTKEQVKYVESVVVGEIQNVIGNEVKKWDRRLKTSSRNSFVELRVSYKKSHRPIAYYAEKDLESHLICDNCTLEYAVFGKFAYCPDCGVDNTLQILRKNMELVHKLLVSAKEDEDSDFQGHLIQNALEDVVSTFDSFGRNSVRLLTKNTDKSEISISFQNIIKAREKVQNEFSFDICDGLEDDEWKQVVLNFQKRHLISHNDGIVDNVYLEITNDKRADLGRMIMINTKDVEEMLVSIEQIAQNLQSGLVNWKSLINSEGD